jgi:4-hydroxybenzoate polyprenyltransferase
MRTAGRDSEVSPVGKAIICCLSFVLMVFAASMLNPLSLSFPVAIGVLFLYSYQEVHLMAHFVLGLAISAAPAPGLPYEACSIHRSAAHLAVIFWLAGSMRSMRSGY